MEGKTLLLEGLPDDFKHIKSKLELHFKNKRRSGGEVIQIQDYPQDSRKALLVYFSERDCEKVLNKEIHCVDFKALGVVELKVSLYEAHCSKTELSHKQTGKSSQAPGHKPAPECHTGSEADASDADTLTIESSDPQDEDILKMYFEQFSDKLEMTKHGKNSWTIKFANHSDLQKVLDRKEHDFGLSVRIHNEADVGGKWDPHRFILTGFTDSCKHNLISLFVSSCTQGARHTWEIADEDRIVVTFETDIDEKSFIRRCSTKKFKGMEIEVSRMDFTDSVLVEGETGKISEDILTLYFTNEKRSHGGAIKSLAWTNMLKSAVITFEDFHAAYQVVAQKHVLCGVQLRTTLFYPKLEMALTGASPPLSSIPTNIIIPINEAILSFLKNNEKYKVQFQDHLQTVHTNILFDNASAANEIVLEFSLDKDSLAALRLGPQWENKAREEAQAFLAKYRVVMLTVEPEVWEWIEHDCHKLNSPDANISYKEAKSAILVVGVQNEVEALLEGIRFYIAEYEVERNNIVRTIQVGSKEELELIAELVHGKLQDVISTQDENSLSFSIRGLKDPVMVAEGILKNVQDNVEKQALNVSEHLMKFMMSLNLKKFEQDHFAKNHISASFVKSENSLWILAEKANIQKARIKVREIFSEEFIQLKLEQSTVIKSDNWRNFFTSLQNETESCQDVCNVSIVPLHEEIVVSGFLSAVADVSKKLRGYLENNTPITEVIPVCSKQKLEFVHSFLNLLEVPKIKNLDVIILPCMAQKSPCLEVTATKEKIGEAVDEVRKQLASVHMDSQLYSEAGQAKVLRSHEANLKAKAKECHCQLHLSLEQVSDPNTKPQQDFTSMNEQNTNISNFSTQTDPQVSMPDLQKVDNTEVMIHGVSVSLKKGDITKETVDLIVNSSNRSLDLNCGVSGAILKAAGNSVIEECKKHGCQNADGVVITGGGNLKCKHIAHMVGPISATDIISSIQKVLQLCEDKMVVTVAIPAIGTGKGGIKPNQSLEAILMGVEKYLMLLRLSCLKEIFIVAFEDKICDAFLDYLSVKPCVMEGQEYAGFRSNQRLHQDNGGGQCSGATLPPNQVKIGQVRIEVRRGDITSETVRGIVNTTNRAMDLKRGVSGAILKAGGSALEDECKKLGQLGDNTVAVTGAGGNLHCDFVVHMLGPHSAADATARVRKVLECCEEKQITTVSFPAVGTGGGGLKGTQAITAMLKGFQRHFSQHPRTVVKLIYVVIDRDEVLQDFLKGLQWWDPERKGSDSDDDSDNDDDDDDDDGDDSEAVIGQVKVKMLCGDITKETTDAIVNSSNTNLNLNSGVSGAILKAAGQTVINECRALGTQPSDGVVFTKAGNLPTKHIVHVVGQTKERDIYQCMHKVLKECDEKNIQSVSFPALGTGAGNLAPAQVAAAMISAIAKFSVGSPKFVTSVRIIIYQSKMLPGFENALKLFKARSSASGMSVTPKQTLVKHRIAKPPLRLAEPANMTFPTMTVQIYSTSPADLAMVKKFMDDLISEECISKDIVSEHLTNLHEVEKEAIMALSQSNQVRILVAALDKLTVSGKKDDTLDTELKINKFLQVAKERELQKNEERRLKETLCWEVAKNKEWKPLHSSNSYQLELAYHRKEQKHTYLYKGEIYTVDFKEMIQTDSRGNCQKVKRRLLADTDTAIIQPPPTWTKMDGKDLDVIVLPPDSKEYKRLEKEFLQTSRNPDPTKAQNITVIEICRIQSQSQWQKYCVMKQALDKKYPMKENEQILYHGTTKDIISKIDKNGFNRSFCGRNATYFGQGTYFAKEAWYSCQDIYSTPDENGLKYIYRALVLTGSPCKGVRNMKEPDPLDPKNPSAGLHDCAVNDLNNPFIYVIFVDAGAYPEYLISFKGS